MGRKEFGIQLNDDKETYYAGEQVLGKVLVNFNEPTNVSKIILYIKGTVHTKLVLSPRRWI